MNGSLLENPINLQKANDEINTMMQQMDPTWHPHMKLEYFKPCVRTTMQALGHVTKFDLKQKLVALYLTGLSVIQILACLFFELALYCSVIQLFSFTYISKKLYCFAGNQLNVPGRNMTST